MHAPTSDAPFYWLLPMRVKLLSHNKAKKFAGPFWRRHYVCAAHPANHRWLAGWMQA